jgi:hypothetical protein
MIMIECEMLVCLLKLQMNSKVLWIAGNVQITV